jgi:hypothetical protein
MLMQPSVAPTPPAPALSLPVTRRLLLSDNLRVNRLVSDGLPMEVHPVALVDVLRRGSILCATSVV